MTVLTNESQACSRTLAQTVLLVFVFTINAVLGAETDSSLERWNQEFQRIRVQAENDAPAAYKNAQSLQSKLPREATPIEQARILNLVSRIEVYLGLNDLAAKHAQYALDTATRAKDRVGQIEAQLNIALNSVNQGRIDALTEATTSSLTLLEGINRPDLQVEALLRTAMMYRRIGQVDESVEMTMQAMEIARQFPDDHLMQTYAHQGLAISYEQSDHPREAFEHFSTMASEARAAQSKLLEGYALVSLGTLKAKMGKLAAYESDISNAVTLFRSVGNPFALGHGLFAQAGVFRHRRQYSDAVSVLNEAVDLYERYPNQIGLWWCLDSRSGDYLALGNTKAALGDLEHAYGLAKEIQLPLYRSQSAKKIAAIVSAQGDYRRAYALAVEANELAAKAAQEKVSTRVSELAQRYESESKRVKIEELTSQSAEQGLRQRWLWTVLGGITAMLAVSAHFLVRLRRSHRSQTLANAELEHSRTELERQTSILQSILRSMGDGVIVVDSSGKLLLANPAAREIVALENDVDFELGRYQSEVALYLPDKVTPYPQDQLPLRQAIQGRPSDNVEVFLKTSAVPEGKWLSITARPLMSQDQALNGGVAVIIDVTAQKEAAALLLDSERKFRTLAEHSPDGIARYDRKGRRVYANPSFEMLTGRSMVEVIQDDPNADFSRCANVSAEDYQRILARVLNTGETERFLTEWDSSAKGETTSHATTIVSERDTTGKVVGAITLFHDVTPLRRAEQRLSESYALLRKLAAKRETAREEERSRISRELHDELGQLITALRLGISTLRLQFCVGNPEFSDRVGELIALADRTLQGIRDVATLLRPPALDMGVVAALEWLVSEFEKHTEIRCIFSSSHQGVDIDEGRALEIFRLVQESLTNIARHSGARSVKISFNKLQNSYLLEIKDDGKGFDPAHTGGHLGLVGMKERSAILGGEITVAAVPGKGTTIRITIPEDQILKGAT